MFVLFKNCQLTHGAIVSLAFDVSRIVQVRDDDAVTSVFLKDDENMTLRLCVPSPIETVVGLINQALGQTAVPDQPEKSVVIIEGK